MEKERAIQCVPVELLERLRALADRLWKENNPSSVHLNAILEEFEPDVKTLNHLVSEYETDYAARLAFNEKARAQKEGLLRAEVQDCNARLAGQEADHAADLKKIEELKAALSARDLRMAELKAKATEDESVLNARYAAKMQELFDRVNKKELELMDRWEEKNKSIERRVQSLESDYSARLDQLKLREKALEEDFNGRKAELIKTFDRIRAGLEAREKTLSVREAVAKGKGGSL